MGKKFDVVLGNPPYQTGKGESGGKSSLWRKFTTFGFSLLKENGILSLVVPQLSNTSKDLGPIFAEHQVDFVCTDASNYFSGIGSKFVYWGVSNSPKYKPTKLINQGSYYDVTNEPIPNNPTTEGISILSKLKNISSLEEVYHDRADHNKVKVVDHEARKGVFQSPDWSKKHCFKLRRTSGDTPYFYSSESAPHHDESKITYTQSGNPHFMFHDGESDPISAVKHQSGSFLCTEEESVNMIAVFESKLSKYYQSQVKTGGMCGHMFLKPDIDYTKSYSDEDLYELYNLTAEEVAVVEASNI